MVKKDQKKKRAKRRKRQKAYASDKPLAKTPYSNGKSLGRMVEPATGKKWPKKKKQQKKLPMMFPTK